MQDLSAERSPVELDYLDRFMISNLMICNGAKRAADEDSRLNTVNNAVDRWLPFRISGCVRSSCSCRDGAPHIMILETLCVSKLMG